MENALVLSLEKLLLRCCLMDIGTMLAGLPELLILSLMTPCYLHPGMFRKRGIASPDGEVLPMENIYHHLKS